MPSIFVTRRNPACNPNTIGLWHALLTAENPSVPPIEPQEAALAALQRLVPQTDLVVVTVSDAHES